MQKTVSVASLRVPEKALKHFGKALKASAAERDEECEREIAEALAIAPEFAKAYVLRASRQLHAARFEQAIENALVAKRIDPGVKWASTVLAGAENSLRHFQEALLVLDSMNGAEADAWQAGFERSRATIGIGDTQGALHWTAIILQTTPEERLPDAHLLRANALRMANRREEAIAEMETYLAFPAPQAHRDEVLRLLASVKEQARLEALALVASR